MYLNQIGLINRFFSLDNMSVRGTYIYSKITTCILHIIYIELVYFNHQYKREFTHLGRQTQQLTKNPAIWTDSPRMALI